MDLKQYVKERDEMLLKCDVGEFRRFVAEHQEYFPIDYVRAFNAARDEVLEISLHKMIVNVTSMPMELRAKSKYWLKQRGYSAEIN